MIKATGFPRSGTHRIMQAIYSLVHGAPSQLKSCYREFQPLGYLHRLGNEIEGQAIHTVRNPVDVAVSMMAHFKCSAEQAVGWILNGGKFLPTLYYIPSRDTILESFLNRKETLVVRYEEFGEEQVQSIADFIGVPYVAGIPEWNSRDKLKAQEQEILKTTSAFPAHYHDEEKHRAEITAAMREMLLQSKFPQFN